MFIGDVSNQVHNGIQRLKGMKSKDNDILQAVSISSKQSMRDDDEEPEDPFLDATPGPE